MQCVALLNLLAAGVSPFGPAALPPQILENKQEVAEEIKRLADKALADIRINEQALELYRLDMFSYPTSDEGLQALTQAPENHRFKNRYRQGGYIRKLETDPWGNDYQYKRPGDNGPFDLFSYGADGQQGGEGMDRDIGNWE